MPLPASPVTCSRPRTPRPPRPACFLVKTVGGEIKKQESEIEEIKLFSLNEIPEALAFEHALMIKDYVAMREASAKSKVT